MIKFLVVALVLAGVFADETPATPVWPTKFKQCFSEKIKFPLKFDETTEGCYYYDEPRGCYRIERDNCKNDRYVLSSGKCSHIVVAGNRYIYKPDKNDCCYCCNASKGCGILKHDWMANAQYKGQVAYTTPNGENLQAYFWDKPGLQDNDYYETIADNPLDRKMLRIYQHTDDDMLFDHNSLQLEFEEDACDLPSVCSLQNKCLFSICSGLRGEETPTEE